MTYEERVYRVATYCRVSTSTEDQLNSFERQMQMYKDEISMHSNWILYRSYYDRGQSGTDIMNRPGFLAMKQAGLEKMYDILITREVSRLSRNIQQFYEFVRPMVRKGIHIIFLDDEVDSSMPDFEIRAAGLISHAQDESRKTSQRVKRGQNIAMRAGNVFGGSLLGYDVKDSKLYINYAGAETVRHIFDLYVNKNMGIRQIKKKLESEGYKTVKNKYHWNTKSINYILHNEKYCGDIIQGKTITTDYLTHERHVNNGEKIIIENHHEAIISRETWEKAQKKLEQRNDNNSISNRGRYIMSGKIQCACCGKSFVSRTRTNGIRVWRCATVCAEGKKNEMGSGCVNGKQLRDDNAIYMLFTVYKKIELENEKIVYDICNVIQRSLKSGLNIIENEKKKCVTELERLKMKQRRLLETELSGQYSKEIISEKSCLLKTEYKCLEEKLLSLNINENKDDNSIENKIKEYVESVLECERISKAYLRSILKKIVVYPDMKATVEIEDMSNVWIFEL